MIVEYESANGIARVTMNRPAKLNALNQELVDGLHSAWQRFSASQDKVAILSGSGEKGFCAGIDRDVDWFEMWPAIPNVGVPLRKPVIAEVHGHCIGGGYILAQHCDLIVAADNSTFWYPEASFGNTGGVGAGLAGRIPAKIALEFILIGEPFSAERAFQVGMINRVVRRPDLRTETLRWAQRIADSSAAVVRVLKAFADETIPRGPAELSAHVRAQLPRLS